MVGYESQPDAGAFAAKGWGVVGAGEDHANISHICCTLVRCQAVFCVPHKHSINSFNRHHNPMR